MANEPVLSSARVRASDADRERVAAVLRAAAGKGLLSLDEVDERLGVVYAATYVADLAPVTADLPDGGRQLAPVDLAARAHARARVRAHVAGYLAAVALMVGIWVLTGADYYFWPIWPALGMLPGVVSHALAARRAGDPTYRSVSGPRAGCGARAVQQARSRVDRVAA